MSTNMADAKHTALSTTYRANTLDEGERKPEAEAGQLFAGRGNLCACVHSVIVVDDV